MLTYSGLTLTIVWDLRLCEIEMEKPPGVQMCFCLVFEAGEGVHPGQRRRRHVWDGGREAAHERARHEWGESPRQPSGALCCVLLTQWWSAVIRPHRRCNLPRVQSAKTWTFTPGKIFQVHSMHPFLQCKNYNIQKQSVSDISWTAVDGEIDPNVTNSTQWISKYIYGNMRWLLFVTQVDTDKDRLVSLSEFIAATQKEEFLEKDEWEVSETFNRIIGWIRTQMCLFTQEGLSHNRFLCLNKRSIRAT